MTLAAIETAEIFDFKGNEVRVLERGGEVWFVSMDVGRVLGLGQQGTSEAVVVLPDKFKDYAHMGSSGTSGGLRKHRVISYEGVTLMIMRSRKPQAVPFQLWIATEVIPSIYRNGFYFAEPKTEMEMLAEVTAHTASVAKRMVAQERMLNNHEKRIAYIEEQASEGQKQLFLVERAEEAPPDKTVRDKVVELVRAHALSKSLPYSPVWRKVYTEFKYRYHIDLMARSRKQKIAAIEVADRLGKMDELFKVASAVL